MGTGRLIVKTCRNELPRLRHLHRLQRPSLRARSSRWGHSVALENSQREFRDAAARWRPVARVFRRLFVGPAGRRRNSVVEPTVQGRRHRNPLFGQSQVRLRNPDNGSHGGTGRNCRRRRTETPIDDSFQHSQHIVILTIAKNDSHTRAGPFRTKRPAPNRLPSATDAHHRIFSGKNSRMRSS